MNITEYLLLVNKPETVHDRHTEVLEKIVQEFPYFQSARALYLKGLYNQNSFKYNYALKIAAAHTADRSVLFDFITSDTFTSVNKTQYEQKLANLASISVHESQWVAPDAEMQIPKPESLETAIERSILSSIKEAGQEVETAAEADFPVTKIPMPHPELAQETASETASGLETVSETATTFEATASAEIESAPETEISVETALETTREAVPAEVVAETPFDETLPPTSNDSSVSDSDIPKKTVEDTVLTPVAAVSETIEKLELGKPLDFSIGERHSFQEWLQISRFQPIDRSKEVMDAAVVENTAVLEPSAENIAEAAIPAFVADDSTEAQTPEIESAEDEADKQKKNDLINRFIENNPKIPKIKPDAPLPPSAIVEPSMADNSYLMTETLARVYLEQHKFSKAIQAYEILILKYPEKSSFFADRISEIKNLQQNHKS